MEQIFKTRGTGRSKGLSTHGLTKYGWNETHTHLLQILVAKICEQGKLYWPDPANDTICIFPDASKYAWGETVTAVFDYDPKKLVYHLDHLTDCVLLWHV